MSGTVVLSLNLVSGNHQAYVEQCLRSVLAQTDSRFEVNYLDNASEDRTYELAKRLLSSQQRIRFSVQRNQTPRLMPVNSNLLLSRSGGRLLTLLSADDWLAPNFVERKLHYFEEQPECQALLNGGHLFHQNEDRLERVRFPETYLQKGVTEWSLLEPWPFFVGATYQTSLIRELGGWDEEIEQEDAEMLVRLSRRCCLRVLDEPLVFYRRHPAQHSADLNVWLREFRKILAKHGESLGWDTSRTLGEQYRRQADLYLQREAFLQAAAMLLRAFLRFPLNSANLWTGRRLVWALLRRLLGWRG